MTKKIKVAIVLPYFGDGGAEAVVSQLAARIDPSAFLTEIFCVYGQPQGNHLEQALIDKGIRIHYIGKKKGPSVRAAWKLFRELDQFDPDLVHTHLSACVYTALWPLVRGKKFFHTFHLPPKRENRRLLRRVLSKTLIGMKCMMPVAISRENQRLLAEYYHIPEQAIPVVHNPVDISRFSVECEKTEGTFSFITAGRLSPQKNQKMMLRAFAAFLDNGYDARLVILGKGEEEASLKELVHELGIGEKVEFPGYVVNVEKYLAGADVFLLSSDYEAQPLAVLEAMAAGLPVISTDVGGVRDIVTDNGILITAGDVGAMTEAMVGLYLDKATREHLAQCARRNAADFDADHTAQQYMQLYRRYIEKCV